MTEKQIQNYQEQKQKFLDSNARKGTNIGQQIKAAEEKAKKINDHIQKLKFDLDKIYQSEFPPIEEYYSKAKPKKEKDQQSNADSLQDLHVDEVKPLDW